MPGKILTVANHKGGVGKTTLTQTLGLGLAAKGYRVVLVDADAQATLTQYALGMKPEPGFYDFVVREGAEFRSLVRQISPEIYAVDDQASEGWALLLPGNGETRHIANSVSNPTVVRERFAEILELVDFVIFDPSPTESMLHPLTYVASDLVIHPTLCEDWSVGSLRKTLDYVKATQGYRRAMDLPDIVTLGIVPTMYQSRTITHTEVMGYLREAYDELVWEPLHRRIAWGEAAAAGQPVFSYMPGSDAAHEAWRFINRFIEAAEGVTHGA